MERRWYRIRIMKALALVALLLFSSFIHAADVPLADIFSPQADLPAGGAEDKEPGLTVSAEGVREGWRNSCRLGAFVPCG
jgi:hypothetical protein